MKLIIKGNIPSLKNQVQFVGSSSNNSNNSGDTVLEDIMSIYYYDVTSNSIYYYDVTSNKYDELEEVKNSNGFARYLLAKRIKLLGTAIQDSIFKETK